MSFLDALDNRIYILHGLSRYSGRAIRKIRREILDPRNNSWQFVFVVYVQMFR